MEVINEMMGAECWNGLGGLPDVLVLKTEGVDAVSPLCVSVWCG